MLRPPRPITLQPILRQPPPHQPMFPMGPGGSRAGGLIAANGPMGPPPTPTPMDSGFEGHLPTPGPPPGMISDTFKPMGRPNTGMPQGPITVEQLRKQLSMLNMMQMLARLGKHAQKHVGDVQTPSSRFPGSQIPGN